MPAAAQRVADVSAVRADVDALFAAYAETRAPVLTPANARAYAGRYRSDEIDVDWMIEADGTDLMLRRGRGEALPLIPTVERTFRRGSTTLVFDPFGNGPPTSFTVDAGRVRGIRFMRVSDSR